MPDFVLKVHGGVTPGMGVGPFSIGTGGQLVEIWKIGDENRGMLYVAGMGSYGMSVAEVKIYSLPQPASTFSSHVDSADQFYGSVVGKENSIFAGIGYGYSEWEWEKDSPAYGTKVSGWGWMVVVGAGVNIAMVNTMLMIRLGWIDRTKRMSNYTPADPTANYGAQYTSPTGVTSYY
jgi:hypothetical protein